jgi:EAL domain-containing protein (putative c-di-GMP-specific phosphodiesterase class I)
VIGNAFAAYQRMRADGLWSINISPATLNSEGIIEFVREQSVRYGVPPQAICFEIAEASAAANAAPAVDFIWGLKADGFRFALDDFGVGMSSFSWLKTLPVDYLKIDGQFVKQMLSDRVSFSVVQAICHIAGAIGLETIAECVEDRQTLEKLEALGVNYAQGYIAGQPSALELKDDRVHGVLAGLFPAA